MQRPAAFGEPRAGAVAHADIEQTLTLGAHGPYRVHVIWVP